MKKFIIMAVSLLLTALLALAGCMYAIGENKAESKPYDMGETVSVTPEDTPEAQKEMEKKFSVYNHVTEENGKKILTLFSEEQAEEQWMKRKNGEEFRLTYDEILFLINDSERLYETYDEIILTNANAYGISEPSESSLAGYRIISNKGDLAGLTYTEEKSAYGTYSRDVTTIAAYRVAMLDSRMRKGRVSVDTASGIYSVWQAVGFADGEEQVSGLPWFGADVWMLIPDDVEWESEEAYRKALMAQLSHGFSWLEGCQHEQTSYAAMTFYMGFYGADTLVSCICTYRWGETDSSYEWKDWLLVAPHVPEGSHQMNLGGLLFPEKLPLSWELKGSYLEFGGEDPAAFYFWRNDGKYFSQLHTLTLEEKASLQKFFGDPQEAVARYLDAEESYTVEEAGGYFLELDLGNGTSVLYPPMATYRGEYLLGCFVETKQRTYEVYENLSFRPCLRQEFMLALTEQTLSEYQHFLPAPPVESITGDVLVAWQTATTPCLVLREDGTGYLKGISEQNRFLPVKYELQSKGRLYVWYEDEAGEKQIWFVFRKHWDGMYIYNAKESQGQGAYLFPDGTIFYTYTPQQ
ncbi:MAG: hypothetical protein J6S15_04040 [Clostridia bacterium]|nr:hypothetical protein [Clostridia bacterium]